ncbi:MAG: preprotein translocase subunit SecA, partial [Candidatus Hydrogenedentes bacterium]|nr:preprotein translocase subunit SecA [Candidatus Hydrogenedentota bacterium]
ATNMAGRGTDIVLGEGVTALGGLHVLGTERHEARRIDNQLRGRSGRQGDAGSSEFFLSFDDDLMCIFAPEWTVKALSWIGWEEGQPIYHKRISKGIEKAQKKVEERNFEIRKNLLEYDEVMDHQRHTFYERRQKMLEGRDLEGLVMDMLRQSVQEAVANYLDGDYHRRCIAEWAGQYLQIPIEGEQIRADELQDLPNLEDELRNRAKEEASSVINITLGEYMDAELDRSEWDLRGLSGWAMSRFNVSLSQNQLRKMDPHEVEGVLAEAAAERIDAIDLSPLAVYLEPSFSEAALAAWARDKFAIDVTAAELAGEGQSECDPAEACEHLMRKVEAAYRRREIEYPVEYA